MSHNRYSCIGNLGRDVEVKAFQSGDRIANVSVGTSKKWKTREGERREHTEWSNWTFRGGLVDVAEKYLRKGSKVFLAGEKRTREYTDRDGNKRQAVEFIVEEMTMLDGAPKGEGRSGGWGGQTKPQGQQGGGNAGGWSDDLDDDDVPFATPYPVAKRGII